MSGVLIHVIRCPTAAVSIRLLHTSNTCPGKANVMRKVLKFTVPKKKYKYYESPPLISAQSFTKGAIEGNRSPNAKRVSVLNKLFMRHITDLMSSGENSFKFVNHGIQINRVQVLPDFSLLKVFWASNGVSDDAIIDEILAKNAGPLRHELTQLRIAGVVPKIEFVKDMAHVKMMELDSCLAKIGCDINKVKADYAETLKTPLELNMELNPEIKEKILSINDEFDDEYEEPLPEMAQDVLGLNHADILQRIKAALKKSKALHRVPSAFVDENEQTVPAISDNLSNVQLMNESAKAERDAFVKFLRQKQILKSKLLSKERKHDPNVELVKQELWERQQQKYESESIIDNFLDGDYLEEENEK